MRPGDRAAWAEVADACLRAGGSDGDGCWTTPSRILDLGRRRWLSIGGLEDLREGLRRLGYGVASSGGGRWTVRPRPGTLGRGGERRVEGPGTPLSPEDLEAL